MRRDVKWGSRALVMAVLTMAVSLSERAQAQQTGLFPLAPIRRERPPCPNEDAVYKYYKQQYFGYHPTCWSPFPAGWGCPSKQTADREKEFAERPLGKPPEMDELGPEDEFGPQPRQVPPNMPDVQPPADRDPFLMDGPAAQPPGGGQNPRATPRRSPFEDLPKGAAVSPSRRGDRARTVTPGRGDDAPELSAPAPQPEQNTSARLTGGDADGEAVVRGDNIPVLNVEDLDSPRSGTNAPLLDSHPTQPTDPTVASNSTNQAPPPRRGLISNLFGGLGLNWMRR
ncbi:MAG: hypothetical protein ACLQGP_29825 [Isosphaeraceae bacterium]